VEHGLEQVRASSLVALEEGVVNKHRAAPEARECVRGLIVQMRRNTTMKQANKPNVEGASEALEVGEDVEAVSRNEVRLHILFVVLAVSRVRLELIPRSIQMSSSHRRREP
jgi:hypothetical protein